MMFPEVGPCVERILDLLQLRAFNAPRRRIVTDSSRRSDVRMSPTVLVRALRPVLQGRHLGAPS